MPTTRAHTPSTQTPLSVSDLAREPNALAPHYSRFRVSERLLLTGHSHQAWPDRAREGQIRAFDDLLTILSQAVCQGHRLWHFELERRNGHEGNLSSRKSS